MKKRIFILPAVLLMALPAQCGTAVMNVDAAKPGPPVNPRLYGIFLEEINASVDGGLYAELVANRAFEDSRPPDGATLQGNVWRTANGWDTGFNVKPGTVPHWSLVKSAAAKETAQGAMTLESSGGLNANTPYCLRLEVEKGPMGVANDGFWGIGAKAGAQYDLRLFARANGVQALSVRLEDAEGAPLSNTVRVTKIAREWQEFKGTIKATRSDAKARLVIWADDKGTLWLDFVSLFPRATWKNRGLRPDLAQMIADLKPGFVRFPGGCVIEGGNAASAYNWRDSLGPVTQRREAWSAWNHRRTYGMGFYEYLQFCDDIGAAPLWVNFAGMSCIFRGKAEVVPMEKMGEVTASFLDGIEFANGPASSKWGAQRAASGRAKPFNLNLVEISNESAGAEFPPRYALVQKAIKSQHPQVQCIADLSWIGRDLMKEPNFDIEDNHIYSSTRWFSTNADVYKNRDAKLPPLYLGEVAVTSGDGGDLKGNLRAALAEGIFMMGCEKQSDKVNMISYAPLISHVSRFNGWHGMIYHDSTRSFGTVSYYLWKLFGHNVPERTLATDVQITRQKPPIIEGGVGVGTWNTAAEFKEIRIEKAGQTLPLGTAWQNEGGRWSEVDGARRQSDNTVGLSFIGDPAWTDYTLSLKARKISGAEGFLIVFGRQGDDKIWWNLGGWGNREHALEFNQSPMGAHVPGSIETGRWYDIKVEVSGARAKCYLDGKLIHDEAMPATQKFFASAGRDAGSGEIILKAINLDSEAMQTTLRWNGLKPGTAALCTVLRADKLSDNNSIGAPTKIVPQSSKITLGATYEFPPHSLTVLRFKPQ